LAFCLAGHHAGLADGVNGGRKLASLTDRLDSSFGTDIPALDPAWHDEISLPDPPPLPKFRVRDPKRGGFQFALFARMLFSCLIDADRRDTADYYNHIADIRARALGRHLVRYPLEIRKRVGPIEVALSGP
jgi:CRISPR-associated endonuclease/helicase Cas3